jgi:hypothetical protein
LSSRRRLAVGGVAGPVTFIAAWAILGARRSGYSPVDDPISRLAAVHAPTRPAMTAGIVALGLGLGAYALTVRPVFGRPAAATAAVTAAATFGVAALPLESSVGGAPHAAAAGVAYATLAATPVLAGRSLAAEGHRGAATASVLTGLLCGSALLASAAAPSGTGLWQRLGLTVGHAWIATSALWLLRRPDRAGPRRRSLPSAHRPR